MYRTGFVTVYIDEITPCLKEVLTGEIVKTEIVKITSKKILKTFNIKTGWYINWSKLPDEVEVYGLRVKGSQDIQGLVGVYNDKDAGACYIQWMCTAPQNNIYENKSQKYLGVGGHLFAIAISKAREWGYDGCIFGFAKDRELLKHYVNKLGAEYIGVRHENHFVIAEEAAKSIEEVYDYEWTDKEI